MLTRLDARVLDALAELAASRHGQILVQVLTTERTRLRDDLMAAEAPNYLRLQGKVQQIDDLLGLLTKQSQR